MELENRQNAQIILLAAILVVVIIICIQMANTDHRFNQISVRPIVNQHFTYHYSTANIGNLSGNGHAIGDNNSVVNKQS